MEDALALLARRGGALLLFVLLWTATQPGRGADPPASRKTHAPPSSCDPPLSAPPLLHHPKQPPTVSYDISDDRGSECLKTQMGVQYVLTVDKNIRYFNIYPSSTRVTGECGQNTSRLSLNFTGGSLELTFHKEEHVSYVTTVRACLQTSICNGCQQEVFKGMKTNMTLFKVQAGLSYKCNSLTTLPLADNLSIRITHAQIQAFGITGNTFGLEEECWQDYCRRILPNVLGGGALGICLLATLTYLLVRDNRPHGYERI